MGMRKINYKVRLCADAELGSGLGGELVNDFAPRDIDGFPVLAATHVRGLMRASLLEIATDRHLDWSKYFPAVDERPWPAPLIECVFGSYDSHGIDGQQRLRLCDAAMTKPDREELLNQVAEAEQHEWEPTHVVARTKIDGLGRAEDASLRTTEAISRDVEFSGCVFSDFEPESVEDIACRLALVTVSAIGGSRNRGGQCVVELLDSNHDVLSPTTSNPGNLLKALDAAIRSLRFHKPSVSPRANQSANVISGTCLVELIFIADSPVCCPERPDKSNVIVSGFSIPASAVQGLLLNHINSFDAEVATKLFAAPNFRCWPLQPICVRNDYKLQRALNADSLDFDALPTATRVSLSHRVAKYSFSNFTGDHFLDLAFEDWKNAPDGSPLKAADGVLLTGDILDESPLLWRAAEMPHYISGHGVTNGPPERSEDGASRNLFSVDAMAPIVWRGIVSLPASVADWIVGSINETRNFSVGKRKSVRGAGRLWARKARDEVDSHISNQHADDVLVLQSPASIPHAHSGTKDADQLLMEVARAWCDFYHLPPPRDVWSDIGILFGWNNSQTSPFQEAVRVFLPGSTIALTGKADSTALRKALLEGFRSNPKVDDPLRNRGFGAITIHPGKAVGLYSGFSTARRIRPAEHGLKAAVDLVLQLENLPFLPSSSQIRSIASLLNDDPASLEKANVFLKERLQSSYKVWADWEQVQDTIGQILTDFTPRVAQKALKALADIAVVHESEDQ